jgi:hypothetical protein
MVVAVDRSDFTGDHHGDFTVGLGHDDDDEEEEEEDVVWMPRKSGDGVL